MNLEQIKFELAKFFPEQISIIYLGNNPSSYNWIDSNGNVIREVDWRTESYFIVIEAERKFQKNTDFWNCNHTWEERAESLFKELQKREKAKNNES
jgi:hypothetical protein